MPGFLLKLPKAAVDKFLDLPAGPIIETAAKLSVFIVLVCFGIFIHALRSPKVASASKDTAGQRHSPAPISTHKKKGRAKKHKKVNCAGIAKASRDDTFQVGEKIEATFDIEDQDSSQNPLEAVSSIDGASAYKQEKYMGFGDTAEKRQTTADIENSFDIEAHQRVQSVGAQGSPEVSAAADDSATGRSHDVGPSDETDSPDDGHEKECSQQQFCSPEARDEQEEALQEGSRDEDACEMCSESSGHMWGCLAHQRYSSSLLLLHRELHLRVVRGPPGLEIPKGTLAPVGAATVDIFCKSVL
jgi:hypothetical protein